ncbi:MAG: hypothetical protein ACSHX9_13095 [Luteolibacter sp.]
MQFLLTLSGREQSPDISLEQLRDYLQHRYESQFVEAVFGLLVSCQRWISRNWSEMKEIGLVSDGGVTNAILFSLFDRIHQLPNSDWCRVADIPLSDLIPRAQAHINAEK